MSVFKLKAVDVGTKLQDTVLKDGSIVDLSGAAGVFVMRKGATIYEEPCTVENATGGIVSITVSGNFPSLQGAYEQEWEMTLPDESVVSHPQGTNNTVFLEEDLSGDSSSFVPYESNTRINSGVFQIKDDQGEWRDITLDTIMGEITMSIGGD